MLPAIKSALNLADLWKILPVSIISGLFMAARPLFLQIETDGAVRLVFFPMYICQI